MNILKKAFGIAAILFLTACSSTSQVIRPAPSKGIQANELNILFMATPLADTSKSKDLVVQTPMREKLKNDMKDRLVADLKEKGINSNFAAIDVLPGVAPTPLQSLFPKESLNRHLLVIVPLNEHSTCYNGNCASTFRVTLSIRAPQTNQELWNMQIEQSALTPANWVKDRNNQFIDDISQAVIAVTSPH